MHRFLLESLPDGMEGLADLALDLRWTWSHEGDEFWKTVSPSLWEQTHNPWLILHSLSRIEFDKLAANPEFNRELRRLRQAQGEYLGQPGWFKSQYPEGTLRQVAYFSMEFGLGEALPLYAGGLGILAGDYLKTASDLNVPMTGIGLLYQEGYFRQAVDNSGWQIEAFPFNDPTSLPILPARDASGGWLKVPLELPGRTVWLRVWQAQVGRTMLYLLDSNDPMNSPADRGITSKLYDSRPPIRLMQEMALGIGGWRILESLNIPVEVCHLNEGHAALVVLERARSMMQPTGESFATCLCAARAGNVFTTHTPVAAGFDTFSPDLIASYFRDYLKSANINVDKFLALGREKPGNGDEPFSMAYLAMRGSGMVNGVSQLHEKVSRRIFQSLYPNWPEDEVPVGHITNGVHVPSWDSALADEMWTRTCGKERWLHSLDNIAEAIGHLSDAEIWALRTKECQHLIEFVRKKMAQQLEQWGAEQSRIRETRAVLDANVLTIGFARRFAAYKRPELLLTDPERLITIINNPKYPVQLVVAGKAHPDDTEGKHLVQQFVNFSNRTEVRQRVVFLEDYDITTAQYLVQGVDLWINTPRRPMEACGTSGMKVLVNGGLNLSEMDGWWAEAYSREFGWSLGDGQEHPEPGWDAVEVKQLYELLEKDIVPMFYRQNAGGIPAEWVAKIRASMARLAPRFSSNRMMREYVDIMYLPAAIRYRQRLADNASLAKSINAWCAELEQHWSLLRFGDVRYHLEEDRWQFQVPVYFGEMNPSAVRVELYASPLESLAAEHIAMSPGETMPGAINGFIYHAEAPSKRPAEHYTPRIIPVHAAVNVPLEQGHILWQK